MTTGLINVYSSRNLGDAAIMMSLAKLSGQKSVKANIADAVKVPVPGVTIADNLEGCQRYISVGGDIFNNSRPHLVTRNFLKNAAELVKHKEKTIVFGQTIPSSCKGLAAQYLAHQMRKLPAVVVRDQKSYDFLKKSGVKVKLSYDVAFVLEATKNGEKRAAEKYRLQGLDPQKTILLSVRNFDALYPHDQDHFETRMARLADILISKGHQVAVLVQSDASHADSDMSVAQRIKALSQNVHILNSVDDRSDPNPVSTLIAVMGLANGVVAIRYHAAILRLIGNKMPFHLYYSRKGKDLNKRLNIPGMDLHDFDPDRDWHNIETTTKQSFDVEPVQTHVQNAFDHAQKAASTVQKNQNIKHLIQQWRMG